MKFKNIEMERMIASLVPLLDRNDKIGYAAARNTRILQCEAKEYLERRDQLIAAYGEPQKDEHGEPTGRMEIRTDSPSFAKFVEEIREWAYMEHEPELFTLPYEEACEKLSGTKILELDWMFEG